ncbi:MAG TPA: transaldolase family protein [Gemmatimonadaceae bacterium]|nr:transaldolase family protein [Gemmatimonadaceae bacterium]
MKILLETADLTEIRWATGIGLAEGVMAPALALAQQVPSEEARDYLAELCQAVPGPVLTDVMSLQADEIYREGRELSRIADNVALNIPAIEEGLRATRRLAREGVRVNSTLVFAPAQALLAAKAGAAYVSLCVSGLADTGTDGLTLVRAVHDIFDNYVLECDLLVTSIHDAAQFTEAARVGANGAVVSPSLLHALLVHPLTDRSLDQMLNAWSKQLAHGRTPP